MSLTCSLVWTQAQTLEVASIKPSRNTAADSNLDSMRGRLTAANITVRELILLAYGVKDYQIGHVPGWVNSERFDIVAKSVSGQGNSLEDEKSLVRELLSDRFQLATHRETKQAAVYLLMVAKDGPKLTPHNDAAAKTRGGCGRLVGRRVSTDVIATMLSRQLDREVLNRSGVSGEFDIQLNFTPDSGPCRAPADSPGVSAAADPSALPSIYTVIQQQLGLKLESAKSTVEFLVIDRVERPSEN
jgi:bla regulator protein blaR1